MMGIIQPNSPPRVCRIIGLRESLWKKGYVPYPGKSQRGRIISVPGFFL
jgi:hypothetical protein